MYLTVEDVMDVLGMLEGLVDEWNFFLIGLVDVRALKAGVVRKEHPKLKVANDKSS